jgi:hypothetical protein
MSCRIVYCGNKMRKKSWLYAEINSYQLKGSTSWIDQFCPKGA